MRLISVKPSDRPNKKFMALFEDEHEFRLVYFGASGYTDYTINKDPEKKRLYLLRHRKNENWNDPMTSGALSRWILWNKPSLRESISDFKRRFNV